MTTKFTPGPWHVEEGQIKDKDNNSLASVPYTLGDETDRANAVLMAAAPDLLAAARFTLETLEEMDTDHFSKGADRPAREALELAIAKVTDGIRDVAQAEIKNLATRIRLIAYPGFTTMRFTAEKIRLITEWLAVRGDLANCTPEALAAEWLASTEQEPEDSLRK